mmetsp:Transcript_51108/g.128979  ORF Transcript_51108/g.128979 Transcript_51108/m.128979 type:complete len:210 (+) Transcript_51108:626-1255(+)
MRSPWNLTISSEPSSGKLNSQVSLLPLLAECCHSTSESGIAVASVSPVRCLPILSFASTLAAAMSMAVTLSVALQSWLKPTSADAAGELRHVRGEPPGARLLISTFNALNVEVSLRSRWNGKRLKRRAAIKAAPAVPHAAPALLQILPRRSLPPASKGLDISTSAVTICAVAATPASLGMPAICSGLEDLQSTATPALRSPCLLNRVLA